MNATRRLLPLNKTSQQHILQNRAVHTASSTIRRDPTGSGSQDSGRENRIWPWVALAIASGCLMWYWEKEGEKYGLRTRGHGKR